jgi:hypothetical protein
VISNPSLWVDPVEQAHPRPKQDRRETQLQLDDQASVQGPLHRGRPTGDVHVLTLAAARASIRLRIWVSWGDWCQSTSWPRF